MRFVLFLMPSISLFILQFSHSIIVLTAMVVFLLRQSLSSEVTFYYRTCICVNLFSIYNSYYMSGFSQPQFFFYLQVLSEEISAKERIVEETEREIDAARGAYQPVATHASVLYFCVSDLAAVEPMYQFSLNWFIALYLQVCPPFAYISSLCIL